MKNGMGFVDLTGEVGPNHIKEEDGDAGPSSGGAAVKEKKEKEDDPYFAFRRRHQDH